MRKLILVTGATVHACVTLTTDPPGGKPYKVDFTAGLSTDQCMNNRGENAWVMVSKKGTTCASLGYVELKNSSSDGDLCHTWKSYWGTSYKIDATGQEVTTNSRWQQGGYIELISQSPGTFVCGSANPCSATSQSWSGTGELWVSHDYPIYDMMETLCRWQWDSDHLQAWHTRHSRNCRYYAR